MKLSDNDFEIMNILWERGDVSAVTIAAELAEKRGWKKPMTYTLIDRLIKKGAIERGDPDYICHATVSRDKLRDSETAGLLERLYNGSAKLLISGLVKDKRLSAEELAELRALIDSMGED